jgi:Maltose operon periplasmic protein precursor (MalM)
MVEKGKQELAAAPVCCAGLQEAVRSKLPIAVEPADVIIDKTRQAFDFGGGKAFFVLYELPPFTSTYSIVITSNPQGPINDISLLIPRVALFDAQFKPTRFFEEKTLRNRGNALERTVFFNPQNNGERYMAVFSSDLSSSIERAYSMVTVTPVVAGPIVFNMFGGQDGKSTLRSAPTGVLKLEVQGLTATAAK